MLWDGEYNDLDTGLVYLRARFYSPGLMRFINADTVNVANLYNFGNGDPIDNLDPSGHMPGWLSAMSQALFIAGAIVGTVAAGFAAAPAIYAWATTGYAAIAAGEGANMLSFGAAAVNTAGLVTRDEAEDSGNNSLAAVSAGVVSAVGLFAGFTGIYSVCSKYCSYVLTARQVVEHAIELAPMATNAYTRGAAIADALPGITTDVTEHFNQVEPLTNMSRMGSAAAAANYVGNVCFSCGTRLALNAIEFGGDPSDSGLLLSAGLGLNLTSRGLTAAASTVSSAVNIGNRYLSTAAYASTRASELLTNVPVAGSTAEYVSGRINNLHSWYQSQFI